MNSPTGSALLVNRREVSYWLIRRKSDSAWLPTLPGGYRFGYTHTEPTREGQPRLFIKEQHAKSALREWLAGILSFQGSSDFEDEVDLKRTPVKSRRAEDMEVVAVTLIVPE